MFTRIILLQATATVLLAATAPAQLTRIVSNASDGSPGNGHSGVYSVAISENGDFVAFESWAALVPYDTNGYRDIYVRDRERQVVTRVSIGPGGIQADGDSTAPAISEDGRWVVFQSQADNLGGSPAYHTSVFLHDRSYGVTTLVSVDRYGNRATGFDPSISADGRYVAFLSTGDLVAGEPYGGSQVYVFDRESGYVSRASVSTNGGLPSHVCFAPAISGNGRYVAFESDAHNLIYGDTNQRRDIFRFDRQTRETEVMSVGGRSGPLGDGHSRAASISYDGKGVAFWSNARNLVAADTNSNADVFVRDTTYPWSPATVQVSVHSSGQQGNGSSAFPSISADGMVIAFNSSTNFDGLGAPGADVYRHDRRTRQTTLTSQSSQFVAGGARRCAISPGGTFVAFTSTSPLLVPGDTNGSYDVFLHGPPSLWSDKTVTSRYDNIWFTGEGGIHDDVAWLKIVRYNGIPTDYYFMSDHFWNGLVGYWAPMYWRGTLDFQLETWTADGRVLVSDTITVTVY